MKYQDSSQILGKRLCRRLTKDRIHLSEEDINPILPYHTRLVEMLSLSALLYALRRDPLNMYLSGLWLAYQSIHKKQHQHSSKSLALLLCAVSERPNFNDAYLERLLRELSERIPTLKQTA